MKTVSTRTARRYLKDKKFSSKMHKQGYTILMPKKNADAWLAALRSGEYIQSKYTLHNENEGGFCCLGLEQYINNDQCVEINKFGDCYKSSPSIEYLKQQGMLYINDDNYNDCTPYYGGRPFTLLNDGYDHTFEELADMLEKVMLVY